MGEHEKSDGRAIFRFKTAEEMKVEYGVDLFRPSMRWLQGRVVRPEASARIIGGDGLRFEGDEMAGLLFGRIPKGCKTTGGTIHSWYLTPVKEWRIGKPYEFDYLYGKCWDRVSPSFVKQMVPFLGLALTREFVYRVIFMGTRSITPTTPKGIKDKDTADSVFTVRYPNVRYSRIYPSDLVNPLDDESDAWDGWNIGDWMLVPKGVFTPEDCVRRIAGILSLGSGVRLVNKELCKYGYVGLRRRFFDINKRIGNHKSASTIVGREIDNLFSTYDDEEIITAFNRCDVYLCKKSELLNQNQTGAEHV